MTGRPFLRDQCELFVDDAGGQGIPVVFQHGLCGDARQTADAFPQNPAYRSITVEMRGHGRSGAGDTSQFSIAKFTEDLAAFIEERNLAPPVIGGISMGAAISLRLAIQYPHLVKGLILARPAWVVDAAPPNMQPNAEAGELLARMSPDEARSVFMAGDTAGRLALEAPDNLESLKGFFSREPIDVTSALLTSISNDGPGVSEQAVRDRDIPTLVIGHERDFVHPIGYAQALAEMINGSEFVEITPKAVDKAKYVAEFRAGVEGFLLANFPSA